MASSGTLDKVEHRCIGAATVKLEAGEAKEKQCNCSKSSAQTQGQPDQDDSAAASVVNGGNNNGRAAGTTSYHETNADLKNEEPGFCATLLAGKLQKSDSQETEDAAAEEPEVPTRSKTEKIRDIVEQSTSDESKKKVNQILNEVRQLPDLEKLLLYLQLPTGNPASLDSLKQSPNNPLGNRFEVTQTITWIKTHLEEDPEVSMPKHEVYEEYCAFCLDHKIKPLSTADFGKVMKQAFPSVRPRRLGTRGNSKYCYAGLRKRLTLDTPKLPTVAVGRDTSHDEALSLRGLSEDVVSACSYVILDWAVKLLEQKFDSLKALACYLVESNVVDIRSVGAFTILSLIPSKGKVNQASILLSQSGGNKHRETQLQLQRKLQEKELIREQRRKLQELKGERPPTKERRRAASGPCGRVARQNSRVGFSQPATPLPHREPSPLPTAGRCEVSNDKTLFDVPAPVPDINSNLVNGKGDSSSSAVSFSTVGEIRSRPIVSDAPVVDKGKTGKVQIPRISSNRQSPKVCLPASSNMPSVIILPTHMPQTKQKPKYKPIQPKPPNPEESSLKRLSDDKETGDAPKRLHLEGRELIKADGVTDHTLDDPNAIDRVASEFFTGREPGEDGIMDYLDGSSASLDQDEELSQYFNENKSKTAGNAGQSAEISQLRRLLEHNLRPNTAGIGGRPQARTQTLRELLTQPAPSTQVASIAKEEAAAQSPCATTKQTNIQPLPPVEEFTGYTHNSQQTVEYNNMPSNIASTVLSLGGVAARRRVSFPSNLVVASGIDGPSSVPPSPTTRCRALNFTPISPRNTPIPDGVPKITAASQPASASVSPFVSPRSTPIPQCRSRHNSGQAPSSYGTTPCSTPYPSEQSSTAPSPFISPHATPVSFPRSRHNSSQSLMQRQTSFVGPAVSRSLAGQSRSRHSSGAALALLSPCSAPLSPMNSGPENEISPGAHFSLPTLGDTPQMRSRHNSSSSVPPQSPRSAPLSPQTPLPNIPALYSLDSENIEWSQPNWMASRHRHASTGATIHHLPVSATHPAQSMEFDAGFLHRSQSVPLYEMIQNDLGLSPQEHISQSYPATPAALPQCHPPSLPQNLVSDNFSSYLDSSSLEQPSDQFVECKTISETHPSDDLQATLEDLRGIDNDFSIFTEELEQQRLNGGGDL